MAVSQVVQVRHGQRVVVFQATGWRQVSCKAWLQMNLVTLVAYFIFDKKTLYPADHLMIFNTFVVSNLGIFSFGSLGRCCAWKGQLRAGFEQNSIVDHHLVVATLLPPWGLPEKTSGPAVYLNAAVALMAHLFGITSRKLDLFMLCGPFKL